MGSRTPSETTEICLLQSSPRQDCRPYCREAVAARPMSQQALSSAPEPLHPDGWQEPDKKTCSTRDTGVPVLRFWPCQGKPHPALRLTSALLCAAAEHTRCVDIPAICFSIRTYPKRPQYLFIHSVAPEPPILPRDPPP